MSTVVRDDCRIRQKTPLLELKNIRMGFGAGGPDIIADINLKIEQQSFVTLFGKSGCGKSTLLNISAGLLKPRSGTVQFNGRELNGVNIGVGYITQEDTLLPWRTVRKNIEVPLKLRKVPRAEIRDRVDAMLDLLNLRPSANKYPAQLSGGMRRRALIARSMIYQPSVLLLDEPFGGIDASLREGLHDGLRRAVEKSKQTVMFVTHDISEATLLSDRVLVFGSRRGEPTRIKNEIEIPFGRSRDLSAIRSSPEFLQLQYRMRLELDNANPS